MLEGANSKLASVASTIDGVSAQAMLVAIVGGETDPTVLADLTRRRLRTKRAELEAAQEGCLGWHQRFVLGA